MAEEPSAEQLRAMAEHRGMKLVRSRKRTPGVGDFGKYGLTDAAGKALLGIGEEGLTATAQEIEAYLRTNALGSWKISAETTPDAKPLQKKKPPPDDPAEDDAPVRRRTATTSTHRPVQLKARKSAPPPREERPRPSTPVLRIVPKEEPAPTQAPPLRIRTAKDADASGVAKLLAQLAGPTPDAREVADNIAALRKAKGQLLVAERDVLVGCCAWTVVPTIQHGPVGRITLLLVDKPHRREGTATAMVEAATAALAKTGCREVEAMSDIVVNNAHNFFRSSKFEQKSYRFVRAIDAERSA